MKALISVSSIPSWTMPYFAALCNYVFVCLFLFSLMLPLRAMWALSTHGCFQITLPCLLARVGRLEWENVDPLRVGGWGGRRWPCLMLQICHSKALSQGALSGVEISAVGVICHFGICMKSVGYANSCPAYLYFLWKYLAILVWSCHMKAILSYQWWIILLKTTLLSNTL